MKQYLIGVAAGALALSAQGAVAQEGVVFGAPVASLMDGGAQTAKGAKVSATEVQPTVGGGVSLTSLEYVDGDTNMRAGMLQRRPMARSCCTTAISATAPVARAR